MLKARHKKFLATSIVFVIVLSMAAASTEGFIKKNIRAANELGGIAQDTVKGGAGGIRQDKEEMSRLLVGTGLGQGFLDQLKTEGYTEAEITAAKMLLERVTYQLKEIAQSQDETETGTIHETSPTEKRDTGISVYRELSEKMDVKTAVYLMLKLNQDFGGIEKVLDEYLYCLQIGMDMQIYLTDKKAYEKERQEKSAGIDLQKIITIEKIEAKMLELLQQKNEESNNNTTAAPENNAAADNPKEYSDKKEELPASPVPEINYPKPKNPGEDVMKEVNETRKRALNPN